MWRAVQPVSVCRRQSPAREPSPMRPAAGRCRRGSRARIWRVRRRAPVERHPDRDDPAVGGARRSRREFLCPASRFQSSRTSGSSVSPTPRALRPRRTWCRWRTRHLSQLRRPGAHRSDPLRASWRCLPGNRTVVHHATWNVDRAYSSRRLDAGIPCARLRRLISHTVRRPDGFFLGWTPGHLTRSRGGHGVAAFGPQRSGDGCAPAAERPREPAGSPRPVPPRRPASLTPIMLRLTRQDLDNPTRATSSFRRGHRSH